MYFVFWFLFVVEGFKLFMVYYVGDGVWVELDILLDENMLLFMVYDIVEML